MVWIIFLLVSCYNIEFEISKWKLWPSKQFSSTPTDSSDSTNFELNSELKSSLLEGCPLSSNFSSVISKTLYNAALNSPFKFEFYTDFTTNIPQIQNNGFKILLNMEENRIRFISEISLPPALKNADYSTNTKPIKIIIDLKNIGQTIEKYDTSFDILIPFAFFWQDTIMISRISFQNELDLRDNPVTGKIDFKWSPSESLNHLGFEYSLKLSDDERSESAKLLDCQPMEMVINAIISIQEMNMIGFTPLVGYQKISFNHKNKLQTQSNDQIAINTKTEINFGSNKLLISNDMIAPRKNITDLPTNYINFPILYNTDVKLNNQQLLRLNAQLCLSRMSNLWELKMQNIFFSDYLSPTGFLNGTLSIEGKVNFVDKNIKGKIEGLVAIDNLQKNTVNLNGNLDIDWKKLITTNLKIIVNNGLDDSDMPQTFKFTGKGYLEIPTRENEFSSSGSLHFSSNLDSLQLLIDNTEFMFSPNPLIISFEKLTEVALLLNTGVKFNFSLAGMLNFELNF